MPVPTFSPPVNPDFPYEESRELLVDDQTTQKGYPLSRPLSIRMPRRVRAVWPVLIESERDYIVSFFKQLNGAAGRFSWEPLDDVPAPTGISPTLSEEAGGTLPADEYFVTFTWYNSTLTRETPESAEASFTTTGGSLVVEVPVIPSQATGWRVYIGTTSGANKREAELSATRKHTQSSALSGTEDPPTTNNLRAPLEWQLTGPLRVRRIRANRWSIEAEWQELLT